MSERPGPVVRLAHRGDLDRLQALETACFDESDAFARRSLRYLIKSANLVLLAELDATVAGSAIVLLRKNSKRARLYSLAVHPSYRGQGVAVGLMAEISEQAVRRGCDRIVLEVREHNSVAYRLYERLGFEPYGTRAGYYGDGETAILMRKDVNTPP